MERKEDGVGGDLDGRRDPHRKMRVKNEIIEIGIIAKPVTKKIVAEK